MDQADELRNMMGKKNARTQRVIAVSSGKGGVGKTNIAINLAIALSNLKQNVIVMDADLGLANVNIILGSMPEYTLLHVVKGMKRLSEIVMDTPFGIQYIAGSSGFSELANLDSDQLSKLVSGVNDLSNTDFIIVDTGAGISDEVLYFILAADEAIIITTPEPTAMLDAYGIIKVVAAEQIDTNLKLIVNRVKKTSETKKVGERITTISKQYLNMDIDYIGFVVEDETVPYSVARQVPFYAYDNKCRASICLDSIAKKLINPNYTENKKSGGFTAFFEKLVNLSSGT